MKNGFTLIELLAVIVILAVLALIAAPLVFNIIEDARVNAKIVSSDNYLKAVEFSIAKGVMENKRLKDGTYPIMPNGNICRTDLSGTLCSNEMIVEVSGETPESGSITVRDGKIANYKFMFKSGFVMTNQICKLISGTLNEVSSKYECEVKKGLKYNFYLLSQNTDGTVNLIMENNIYYDETLGISGIAQSDNDKRLVAWYADSNSTMYGPVTAMTYLYNATKNWDSVPNIVLDYVDEGQKYGGVKTTGTGNLITTITGNDGSTKTASFQNLKARLPMKKELEDNGCDGTGAVSCEVWLSDSDLSSTGVRGYWSLSSATEEGAYRTRWNRASGISPTSENRWGVRPVINIKLK